jgi:hypothetical protein
LNNFIILFGDLVSKEKETWLFFSFREKEGDEKKKVERFKL